MVILLRNTGAMVIVEGRNNDMVNRCHSLLFFLLSPPPKPFIVSGSNSLPIQISLYLSLSLTISRDPNVAPVKR